MVVAKALKSGRKRPQRSRSVASGFSCERNTTGRPARVSLADTHCRYIVLELSAGPKHQIRAPRGKYG